MKAVSRQDLVPGKTYYMDASKAVKAVFAGRDETSIYFSTEDPRYYALSGTAGYENCIAFRNDPEGCGFVPCD